jgi:hypothetical protein
MLSPRFSLDFNDLVGVSCPTTSSCVAVGSAGFVVFSSRSFRTLVEQWDGTSWSIATSPNPSGADVAVLTGVK